MSHEHASGYMRRPCKGHGMDCLLLLLPKLSTGGDWRYETEDNIFLSAMKSIRLWCLVISSAAVFITHICSCPPLTMRQDGSKITLSEGRSGCTVTRLSDESFITFPKWITSLTITAHITILDPGVFGVFHGLKSLSLSCNLIMSIPTHTFLGLTQLDSLRLRQNRIRWVTFIHMFIPE